MAQDVDDESGAWVHAYLHRKEGDSGNAAYRYRRAGQPVASGSLEEEWNRIAAALLDESQVPLANLDRIVVKAARWAAFTISAPYAHPKCFRSSRTCSRRRCGS